MLFIGAQESPGRWGSSRSGHKEKVSSLSQSLRCSLALAANANSAECQQGQCAWRWDVDVFTRVAIAAFEIEDGADKACDTETEPADVTAKPEPDVLGAARKRAEV